ncbi:unnamed protein product [Ectocarpus sp. 12 AP-2014]
MKTIQCLFCVCVYPRHCCCALFTSDVQHAIVVTSERLKPTALQPKAFDEVTNYCCHRPSAWKSESVDIRRFTKRHASTILTLIGLRVSDFSLSISDKRLKHTQQNRQQRNKKDNNAIKKTTTRSPLPASI